MVREELGSITPSCRNRVRRTIPPIADIRIYFTPFSRGDTFKAEYEDWTKSSLASLPIIYVWVDGIYIKAGIADERACLLVVMGADVTGQKHLLAMEEGFRESKESWAGVLRSLKARGMNSAGAGDWRRRLRFLGSGG